jgi:tRNA nucleotidyltransferase (CCA-adding enzyme)
MTVPERQTDSDALAALVASEPALSRVLEASAGAPVYLVGGAVRDALMGRAGAGLDLDIVIDGPVAAVALGLDPDAVVHERFDTATVGIEGRSADIARSRSERYPQPGALPVVEPARIEQDLGRRDFSINAMAVKVDEPGTLIDPHGGRSDIERSLLRVLHERSFTDDPTRALRAARYAARFGFDLELRTAGLIRDVDLSAVSRDRVDAELDLIADEQNAVEAIRLAAAWGLVEVSERKLELLASALELIRHPQWGELAGRREVLHAVLDADEAESPPRGEVQADGTQGRVPGGVAEPDSAMEAVEIAGRLSGPDLVLARAGGAEWLDRWMNDWRDARPEVSGGDLLRAGIPAGEAIGAGLRAALEARLNSGLTGRDAQLEVALSAARKAGRGEPSPK